jgi:hypothetical protein
VIEGGNDVGLFCGARVVAEKAERAKVGDCADAKAGRIESDEGYDVKFGRK